MFSIRVSSAAFGATLLFAAAPSAGAADSPLDIAVAKGARLFATATFDGNGRTCETCHQNGGKTPGQIGDRKLPSLLNAAAIFPRFSRGAGQVVTLEGQLQTCVRGGLGGTPPQLGSPDLVALTAYLGSIANGQQIKIGGEPK